jgi:hypothetical protein
LRVLGLSLLRIWELGPSQSISNPKINAYWRFLPFPYLFNNGLIHNCCAS